MLLFVSYACIFYDICLLFSNRTDGMADVAAGIAVAKLVVLIEIKVIGEVAVIVVERSSPITSALSLLIGNIFSCA